MTLLSIKYSNNMPQPQVWIGKFNAIGFEVFGSRRCMVISSTLRELM